MIQNASSPPTTTWGDIQVGKNALAPIGNGLNLLKVDISGVIHAVNLDTGQHVTIADTDVVTDAPNAEYTMWPTST